MVKVNIIGAGKAGSALAIILNSNSDVQLVTICDCDSSKLSKLYDKIKAENFVTTTKELQPADINIITTSDDLIVSTCKEIVSASLNQSCIYVHCSGALPSSVLSEIVTENDLVASVHPIKSFAEPETAAANFSGTYCGFEGDEKAVSKLKKIFEQCEANCFDINQDKKSLYHAAAVISCNYLNVLMEVGINAYEKAGVTRDISTNIIEDIASDTLKNIFTSSPAHALTGPIARGDTDTIFKHLESLDKEDDKSLVSIYKCLGLEAIKLSLKQGSADKANLEQIKKLLDT